jgi:hypothetical protein
MQAQQVQPAQQQQLAPGAAGLQQALIQHDRVRRTTDIPLFYGRKEKDTITPQQLVYRLEKASRVAQREKRMNSICALEMTLYYGITPLTIFLDSTRKFGTT